MAIEIMQVQEVKIHHIDETFTINLLRSDLFDLDIPGNKFWKMKYNIEEMKSRNQKVMVTFGGAYSNHIAATAAAGKKYNFKSIGIIRGEVESISNPTLSKAAKNGMEFKFIDRETYRNWKKGEVDLKAFLGLDDFYLLPEGGSNELAVKGCAEMLNGLEEDYDIICCPVGTGATLAGIIASSNENQKIIGFSSMKGGEYIEDDINILLKEYDKKYNERVSEKTNWSLNHTYHFGGFAKATRTSIKTYQNFQELNDVELDLIYTTKMIYGIGEMLKFNEMDRNAKILAIHTGGQQGNVSMLDRFSKFD